MSGAVLSTLCILTHLILTVIDYYHLHFTGGNKSTERLTNLARTQRARSGTETIYL